MSQRFFVYDLIDPRDGKVFYVGKGQKKRPYAHEREAINGKQSAKCDKIREILASGNKVKIDIVKRFCDEAEAYQYEADRIDQIGLANLTNSIPGGGGCGAKEIVHTMSDASAQILAHALKCISKGHRIIAGKYDLTDGIGISFMSFANLIGMDELAKRLSKYNVEVTYVEAA
jgi:hypothetical protein